MFTVDKTYYIAVCLEGFLFGIYSGIFALYLQCPSRESKAAKFIFYLLSLLYVLSMTIIVSDISGFILFVRRDEMTLLNVNTFEVVVNGCCDLIAQCILIHRCWIVWGRDIRVVIIPSFLAIAYIATWLAARGAVTIAHGKFLIAPWSKTMVLTGLAASMAVNALATGLIVFKILKVFIELNPTSVERTSGSGSTGSTKLHHIIFVIIESGMVLFAIQLVRVVINSLYFAHPSEILFGSLGVVIGMHQMLNGIAPTLILVRGSMKLSFDDEDTFKEAAGSLHLNNPGVGNSSIPPQKINENICFDISQKSAEFSWASGSTTISNTLPRGRSEDIDIDIVARAA